MGMKSCQRANAATEERRCRYINGEITLEELLDVRHKEAVPISRSE